MSLGTRADRGNTSGDETLNDVVEIDGWSGDYALEPIGWVGGIWGKQMMQCTLDVHDPLMCRLYGNLYRTGESFPTDLGSVPKTLQYLLPMWYAKDRWIRAYLAHDFSYQKGGMYVAVAGGWEFKEMTRKQADIMLRDMILLAGGSKANARTIYWGVRIGGRFSWKGN